MRRLLVLTALSASLAACSNDGHGGLLEDGGDQAATHEDAGQPDAARPDESDDGGEDPASDAGMQSGGSDAGVTMDGGRRDAGQDAGAVRDSGPSTNPEGGASAGPGCAGKTYKLCEDFESASVGALPSGWTAVPPDGSNLAVVSTDQSHSGAKSLKSARVQVGQTRIGRSLASLGTTANKHWGRIFFKVNGRSPDAGRTEPDYIHYTLLALKGSPKEMESRVVDSVVNREGKAQFLYNLPDDSCCEGSDYLYSPYDGQWHCAEWYVDATTKQYRFYYDRTEVKLSFDPNRAQLGNYAQVIVGWIDYVKPEMPFYQAWFDDLAMDDNRIGCD